MTEVFLVPKTGQPNCPEFRWDVRFHSGLRNLSSRQLRAVWSRPLLHSPPALLTLARVRTGPAPTFGSTSALIPSMLAHSNFFPVVTSGSDATNFLHECKTERF